MWRTYVVAVRQVAAIWETKTHETVLRLDESSERCKAGNAVRSCVVERPVGLTLRSAWHANQLRGNTEVTDLHTLPEYGWTLTPHFTGSRWKAWRARFWQRTSSSSTYSLPP